MWLVFLTILLFHCCLAIPRKAILFDHIKLGKHVPESITHEVTFVVKQRGLKELEILFNEIADAQSPRYKSYLTRQEVADMTSNEVGVQKTLRYLMDQGVSNNTVSRFGEFITVTATVEALNRIFSTRLQYFDVSLSASQIEGAPVKQTTVIRALDCSLPDELEPHVVTVLNLYHFPAPVTSAYFREIIDDGPISTPVNSIGVSQYVTPAFINKTYGIQVPAGLNTTESSQCIYSTIEQNYSPADLKRFQKEYNLPETEVTSVTGNYNLDSVCVSSPSSCVEANLDVQYILGVSPSSTTTFWYDDDATYFLTRWIADVSSSPKPPMVISISYGILESYITKDFVDVFDVEAMKLGVQGTTIVAASGDDGVAGYNARSNKRLCGYNPMWPASSPYVVAVGATQGPESGTTEFACSSSTGGQITSGGGFSNLYSQPQWQKGDVDAYFGSLVTQPSSGAGSLGYARNGRAYPDISLLGYNYRVQVGSKWYSVAGTSASAPVFGGMISLVNAARIAKGEPPLGFINKDLYHNHSHFVRDIPLGSGDNLCTSKGSTGAINCCKQGFVTSDGWDPVTGLGSIWFPDFLSFYSDHRPTTTITQVNSSESMFRGARHWVWVTLMVVVSSFLFV